jgi:ribonuclease Z
MVNAPFDDPALYVEILWEHRALLFDLGDLGNLRPSKALKVSHAFVSHTHIDHFIGFDALLRVMLNREKILKIYGPPGFLANVQGKLAGYTWNLTAEYPFSVEAAEVREDQILTQVFHCHERFVPGEKKARIFAGVLEGDEQITVRAIHLDHLLPCLAFALEERFHINVHEERVTRVGLSIGPWLKELKMALWRGEKDEFLLKVPGLEKGGRSEQDIPLAKLRELVTLSPGQKIAYVADCRYSVENAEKILGLVAGADAFFCEAAFLDRDQERAKERAHLTARQAGELAREAKVKRLEIFHFSPKYEKEAEALYREAEEAFRGKK